MAIDVTVLRVFTDRHGRFGNPLGVVTRPPCIRPTGSVSLPNWVTAKPYSSPCPMKDRAPRTPISTRPTPNSPSPGIPRLAHRGG